MHDEKFPSEDQGAESGGRKLQGGRFQIRIRKTFPFPRVPPVDSLSPREPSARGTLSSLQGGHLTSVLQGGAGLSPLRRDSLLLGGCGRALGRISWGAVKYVGFSGPFPGAWPSLLLGGALGMPGDSQLPAWALVSQKCLAIFRGTLSGELLSLQSTLTEGTVPFCLGRESRLPAMQSCPGRSAVVRQATSRGAGAQAGGTVPSQGTTDPAKLGRDEPALPSRWFLEYDRRKHFLPPLSKPILQLQDGE